MTSDGNGGTFTYDLANNMVTASKINSGVYKYNALHQRVEKAVTVSGVTTKTYYIYNTNGSLLGEYDASGNVIAEHVYLKNIPVAVVKGANTYFVHTDYLNTPRAVSNSSGTVVWKWDNVNAYGYNPANETVSGTPFEYNQRFSGQYFDKETGLHYNYHRMYNPELGRYMQPDPIGVNGGMNIYSYVENNPLNYNDPEGYKKLFLGDKKVDTQMLASWYNDEDSPRKIILYGHGSISGLMVSFNNSLNLDRSNLDDFSKKYNGFFITNALDLIKLLKRNNINIDDFDEIEIRSCDVGRGKLPQNIANVFNKNVYAADDYYFFGNTSIGVKSTYRLTDEINGPWFHTPWSRGLTKFEPQGKQ